MDKIDTASELALFDATTQGEWKQGTGLVTPWVYVERGLIKCESLQPCPSKNAAWIARAHNQYPALLSEIDKGREAQRDNEKLYALLGKAVNCAAGYSQYADNAPKSLEREFEEPYNEYNRMYCERRQRTIAEGGQQ